MSEKDCEIEQPWNMWILKPDTLRSDSVITREMLWYFVLLPLKESASKIFSFDEKKYIPAA